LITSTGFFMTVSTPIYMYEGSRFLILHGGSSIVSGVERAIVKAINAQSLAVALTGVTGLKASVFVLGDTLA